MRKERDYIYWSAISFELTDEFALIHLKPVNVHTHIYTHTHTHTHTHPHTHTHRHSHPDCINQYHLGMTHRGLL